MHETTTDAMNNRRFAFRKGFTLIELVLAIAITSILVTCAGYLINSAVRLRQLARSREELLQVSLRLHNAIIGELDTAAYATLYSTPLVNYTNLSKTEQVLFLGGDGYLYLGNALTGDTPLLPLTVDSDGNSTGFDYYDGAKLVDQVEEGKVINSAFSIRLIGVEDYKYIADPTPTTCYRCLQVVTTLCKDDRYYTHTSTIRLSELALYANGEYSGEVYVSSSMGERHLAQPADTTNTFVAVQYRNKGRL